VALISFLFFRAKGKALLGIKSLNFTLQNLKKINFEFHDDKKLNAIHLTNLPQSFMEEVKKFGNLQEKDIKVSRNFNIFLLLPFICVAVVARGTVVLVVIKLSTSRS